MNNHERAKHWRNQIQQWQESGLSGAQFCKAREFNMSQFYYWRDKFIGRPVEPGQSKPSSGFATVVLDSPKQPDHNRLSFTLPNGCAIVGISSSNVALVGAILGQL